jgi:hypothetical protein
MMPGDASAQDCGGWFQKACSDSASTNQAGLVRGKNRLSRAPAIIGSEKGGRGKQLLASAAAPQRAKRPDAARPAKPARDSRSGSRSGEQSLARSHGEPQRRHAGPAMSSQEKEMLFEEFLAWRKARLLNGD